MATRIVNPFYPLLMVVGTCFALTAIPYWFMCLREADSRPDWLVSATGESLATSSVGLDAWLKQHGMTTLLIELGLLAVATFAAIGTDDFWERRANASQSAAAPDTANRSPQSSDHSGSPQP